MILGMTVFLRGRWRESLTAFEALDGQTSTMRTGLANARVLAVIARGWVGELREAVKQSVRLCADAKDRGDQYMLVSLGMVEVIACLADDDPEGAREKVRATLYRWTQTGFHIQHWNFMIFNGDIDLYEGEVARPYDRFMADLPKLEKSLLLYAHHVRAMTFFTRAKLAIASIEARPELRVARIREARRMARRLEREVNPWVHTLAAIVHAMAANAAGDRAAAIAALRTAVARAEATDTHLAGVPARYRLGELLGNAEGREHIEQARETLSAQAIRNPARYVGMFLPGRWGPAP
jgi:hypothetical protein